MIAVDINNMISKIIRKQRRILTNMMMRGTIKIAIKVNKRIILEIGTRLIKHKNMANPMESSLMHKFILS